jgi:AGCS family alanine or glycine:cation symporter
MFVLYIGSSLWIIGVNFDQLERIFHEMVASALSPYSFVSGSAIGGIVSALRWGIFKGVQATEAGLGTQTIPHSMAETTDPQAQGALAMLSTFSAGGIAFLSGCVALITETWKDPTLPLGISMVTHSYEQYFSWVGIMIVAISALLFGFGTILGNSYNGSQCYGYLTQNKNKKRYHYCYLAVTLLAVFLGSLGEVKLVWSCIDIVLVFIAVPHMLGLLRSLKRSPELFTTTQNNL